MEEKNNLKDFSKKSDGKSKENQEDEFYAKEVEKRIDFHVIPNKFRKNKKEMDKTKKTGILIIVFGVVFLVAISILLYIILFGDSKEKEVETGNQIKHGNVPKIDEKKSEEDSYNVDDLMPIEDNIIEDEIEEETATSSPEIDSEIDSETATSSPEVELGSEVKGLIIDMDRDGLSDKEEMLLGTSDNNPDSDGDGYDDLVELENLYNPAGPGLLKDNPNIESYSNNSYGYRLLYPALWERIDLGGDDIVMFSSEENHFIQIIAQENKNSLSIRDWLSEQLGSNIPTLDKEITKSGWEGIFNEVGNIIYATDEKKESFFIISYSFNQGEAAIYKNIFNMLINSFEIL